jgi:hypothetical protein
MEKTQKSNKETILKEVTSHPLLALSYINTLYDALSASNEILYDLSWGKGGSIDPLLEDYVNALVRINNKILEG